MTNIKYLGTKFLHPVGMTSVNKITQSKIYKIILIFKINHLTEKNVLK